MKRLTLLLILLLAACDDTPTAAPTPTLASVDAIGGGVPTVYFSFNDPALTPGPAQSWRLIGVPVGATVYSGTWTAAEQLNSAASGPSTLRLSNAVYNDFVLTAGLSLQAEAGLIFRVQDANNYFLFTADPASQTASFYLYASGKLSLTKRGPVSLRAGSQQLRVEVRGQSLRGFVNGELIVETSDTAYFAGGVGLWAQGQAQFASAAVAQP